MGSHSVTLMGRDVMIKINLYVIPAAKKITTMRMKNTTHMKSLCKRDFWNLDTGILFI